MRNQFMENESKDFKDIIASADLEKVVPYMDLFELDREIRKSYFKGNVNQENYNKWSKWDEDTRMIALRRYVFYSRRVL